MTGGRVCVDVLCLDLRDTFDPMPGENGTEKVMQMGLNRRAGARIENWLKDCSQRIMTNVSAIKGQQMSFPSEDVSRDAP